MANVRDDLLYTEEHEYLKPTEVDGEYLVGVTDYAQGELGDIVFLELPSVGASFARMDTFGTIEAVKAVSDLYAPVSCEILEVNTALDDDPAIVNGAPYDDGWMIRIRVTDPAELSGLLAPEAYRDLIGGD